MVLSACFSAARGGLLSYYTHRSVVPFIIPCVRVRFEKIKCPPEVGEGDMQLYRIYEVLSLAYVNR